MSTITSRGAGLLAFVSSGGVDDHFHVLVGVTVVNHIYVQFDFVFDYEYAIPLLYLSVRDS